LSGEVKRHRFREHALNLVLLVLATRGKIDMQILVWGLGYVGTVSAACLARLDHEVIGIDSNSAKVEAINRGECVFKEPGLHELIK
jgi:UDP-N-acetyl-D-mannosaminuronate dehydrogenase